MYDVVETLLHVIDTFFLVYLLLYASYLFISVVAGGYRLWHRDKMSEVRNELKHDFYYPISLLVPAYNEEVTIIQNVESLLTLDYRLYEIIVIDDGSKDATSQKLIDHFNMKRTDRPIRRVVSCKPQESIHEADVNGVHLTVIKKVNGRKGDALNMGINASQYPWFVCIDADSVLQRDSLEKIVQPVLEDDSIVAVGGMIHILQVLEMENGVPKKYRMPLNPLVNMQVMEYERSFLASRILMDLFNGNLIISGAFGLFRKDIVMAAGGYDTDTLGEDMELVVKLHTFCRNNNIRYSIRYEPSAICWSQAPESMGDLQKQRKRWHKGLFQCLFKYRQIFCNLNFGLVSFISYLYYLIYELLSPFVEVAGLLFTLIFWAAGMLNGAFALKFLLLYAIYGACLTITAFFQRVYTLKMKIHFTDIIKAIFTCILESLVLRYFIAFTRTIAFIGYSEKKDQWGTLRRIRHDLSGHSKQEKKNPSADQKA